MVAPELQISVWPDLSELAGLHAAAFGYVAEQRDAEQWDRVLARSLCWVTAHGEGQLIGFVNVAWDGGDHAFLIDTKTRGSHQRRGVGRELVRVAEENARAAGCEWLHVDFLPDLAPFYVDACGFRPTEAGLVHLIGGVAP